VVLYRSLSQIEEGSAAWLGTSQGAQCDRCRFSDKVTKGQLLGPNSLNRPEELFSETREAAWLQKKRAGGGPQPSSYL
jgi:hypothetical protein